VAPSETHWDAPRWKTPTRLRRCGSSLDRTGFHQPQLLTNPSLGSGSCSLAFYGVALIKHLLPASCRGQTALTGVAPTYIPIVAPTRTRTIHETSFRFTAAFLSDSGDAAEFLGLMEIPRPGVREGSLDAARSDGFTHVRSGGCCNSVQECCTNPEDAGRARQSDRAPTVRARCRACALRAWPC
jgi:hypothetical protein